MAYLASSSNSTGPTAGRVDIPETLLATAAAAAIAAGQPLVERSVDALAGWLSRSAGRHAAADFEPAPTEAARAHRRADSQIPPEDRHLVQLDHYSEEHRLWYRLKYCLSRAEPEWVQGAMPEYLCANSVRSALHLGGLAAELERFRHAWFLIDESLNQVRDTFVEAVQGHPVLAPFLRYEVWMEIKNQMLDAALALPMPEDGVARYLPAVYARQPNVFHTLAELVTKAKRAASWSMTPLSAAGLEQFYKARNLGIFAPQNGSRYSDEELMEMSVGMITFRGEKANVWMAARWVPPGIPLGKLVARPEATLDGSIAHLLYDENVRTLMHPLSGSRLSGSKQDYGWFNPETQLREAVRLFVDDDGTLSLKFEGEAAWTTLLSHAAAANELKCRAFDTFTRSFEQIFKDRFKAAEVAEGQAKDKAQAAEKKRMMAQYARFVKGRERFAFMHHT